MPMMAVWQREPIDAPAAARVLGSRCSSNDVLGGSSMLWEWVVRGAAGRELLVLRQESELLFGLKRYG